MVSERKERVINGVLPQKRHMNGVGAEGTLYKRGRSERNLINGVGAPGTS